MIFVSPIEKTPTSARLPYPLPETKRGKDNQDGFTEILNEEMEKRRVNLSHCWMRDIGGIHGESNRVRS